MRIDLANLGIDILYNHTQATCTRILRQQKYDVHHTTRVSLIFHTVLSFLRILVQYLILSDGNSMILKGQYHEIFYPQFFHQSNPPRPLTNGLKLFCIWLSIRRDVCCESRQI
jgi:hypothetical protein